jgi:hypothetical protein
MEAADSLNSLGASLQPLIVEFNALSSKRRFVAVLSPRCPACVHGAAAIRQALLEDGGPPAGPVFIVWTPMVAGDDEDGAREAMVLFHSPRVRQYYDPDNRVGKLLRREVFPEAVAKMRSSVPPDHFFAGALGHRPKDTPEWDIYMFYDPNVRWEERIPRPSRWVRQVARFAEAPGGDLVSLMWRNSYEDPPVEGDLAEQIAALAGAVPPAEGQRSR